MGLVWDPRGLVGVFAIVVAWATATLVYGANPRRAQNRMLALVLIVEGTGVGLVRGVSYFVDDPSIGIGLFGTTGALLIAATPAYLVFLSALDTPWSRPFRAPWARALLALLCLAAEAWYLAHPEDLVANYLLAFRVWTGALVFGVVCAVSAWRRAPAGSVLRGQARAFAVAFVTRDVLWVLYFYAILPALSRSCGAVRCESLAPWADVALAVIAPTITILFIGFLGYGILKAQLFDIDLRIKAGIRRATTAAAFLACFLIVAQLAEEVLSAQLGWVAGAVATGLLLVGLRPIERAAERVADAAMPAASGSPTYVAYRKMQVYRGALESALVDDAVTPRERQILDRLRHDLGIPSQDAAAVEADVVADRATRERGAQGL